MGRASKSRHATINVAKVFLFLLVALPALCEVEPSVTRLEACDAKCAAQCEELVSTRVTDATALRSAVNNKLRDQINSLKTNLTSMHERLDSSESTRRELDRLLEEASENGGSMCTTSAEEMNAVKARLESAEERLRSSEAANAKVMDSIKARLESTEEQLLSSETARLELERLLTEANERESRLRKDAEAEIEALETNLNLAQERLTLSDSSRTELHRQLKKAEGRESAFRQARDLHLKEMQKQIENMATSETRARELQLEVGTLEKTLDTCEKELRDTTYNLAIKMDEQKSQILEANNMAYEFQRDLFLANERIRDLDHIAKTRYVNWALVREDSLRMAQMAGLWTIKQVSVLSYPIVTRCQPLLDAYDRHLASPLVSISKLLHQLPVVASVAYAVSDFFDKMHATETSCFQNGSRAMLDFLEFLNATESSESQRLFVGMLRHAEANPEDVLQQMEAVVKVLILLSLLVILVIPKRKRNETFEKGQLKKRPANANGLYHIRSSSMGKRCPSTSQ